MKKNLTINLVTSLIVTLFFLFSAPEVWGDVRDVSVSSEAENAKRITGRITDEKGVPMIGVTVVEVGTTNGASSNIDGLYTLITTTKNPQLSFVYIGYTEVIINIGMATVYDIVLKENVNAIDELVVVGYSTQRKVSMIGSQSVVKAEDLKMPSASLSSAIAGRIAGVTSVQRTGEPGNDSSDIWIRGFSTPNGASPLIIVDGVERGFDNIDPNDVESITILKDASATSVYGVRGANGVIIVKTKPGIIGKPVISVDYYESFTKFTMLPKLADGITYMTYANEANANNGNTVPLYSQDFIQKTRDNVDPYLYPNVDWLDEVFNDMGHQRRVNANIRGGSQMVQFYASLSYFNEKGLITENDYEHHSTGVDYNRYNFLTNLNIKLTSTTTIAIGAQGFLGSGNYPNQSSEEIFSQTMSVSPVLYPKMYYVDGVEYVPGIHTSGAQRNPYAEATKRGYRNTTKNNVMSNIRLTQDLKIITKGLKFSTMFAFDINNTRSSNYQKRESTYYITDMNNPYDEMGNIIISPTWSSGSSELSYGESFGGERKENFEALLSYDRTFGRHRVSGMAIYTQQSKSNNKAGNFIGSIPYRIQGVAGRATYSWDDRYLAEFNVGYNGGENFPEESRFGIFPAVGLGWVVSQEKFMKPIADVVSFLKFRYTNGLVGSSNVNNRRFMYIDQYGRDNNYGYSFGVGESVGGVKLSNPATDLTWEIAHKQNLGVDLQLFRGDLSITADIFKEEREQILMERNMSLPGFAGYQSYPYGNVGATSTSGYDLSLEYFKQINKDLRITVRGNFGYVDAHWTDDDRPDTTYPWRNREGHSLQAIEGYTALGLYTESDINDINNWLSLSEAQQQNVPQPFPTPSKIGLAQIQAGDIMYKDMNLDGVINNDDISWIGEGDIPKISYGFGFNVDYKSFSLAALFQGTAQASRVVAGSLRPYGNSGSNVFNNIDDRWTEENPSQDVFYPRLSYLSDTSSNQNNFETSTWWLKDMGFLRLKNIQLTYRLPDAWCRNIKIKNASIYVMGTNIFTISDWDLWDPELGTNNGTKYPNTSSYTIGLNCNF